MDQCRHTGTTKDAGTTALASIAHELASPRDWVERVSKCLNILENWLPETQLAAGFQRSSGWLVLDSSGPVNETELNTELYQHFEAFNSNPQPKIIEGYACEWDEDAHSLAITSDDDFPASCLSLPISTGGRVVGVLHAFNEATDGNFSIDAGILGAAAPMFGLAFTDVTEVNGHSLTGFPSTDIADAMAQAMAGAVVMCDAKGRLIWTNETARDFLGFDPLEVRRREVLTEIGARRIDGSILELPQMPLSRALRGECVSDIYQVVRPKDGQKRWVRAVAHPIKSDGRIVGGVALWRDKTERELARSASEAHLARLQTLLESSTALLSARSVQDVLRCCAQAAVGLIRGSSAAVAYGFDGQDFQVSEKVGNLDIPGDILACSRLMKRPSAGYLGVPIATNGGDAKGVIVVRCPGDSDVSAEEQASVGQLAIIASMRIRSIESRLDAERRALEAEQSRRMLDAMVHHIPEGVIIAEAPDCAIRVFSRKGLEITGISMEDASMCVDDIVSQGTLWHLDGVTPVSKEERPIYRAVTLGEEIENEEWLVRRQDGTELPILCTASPMRDPDGNLTGGIVTFRDISEIKAAQQELESAYRRERRISEVLQQALLPTLAVNTPSHQIAAEYHPAWGEAEVGGDFYDVFGLGDGWVAMVMGDVSGKGLSAAVYTSMAKHMIRAYAHEDPEPRSVMRRLNEALSEYMSDETFITVFYGIYDTTRRILAYANAGHEPPIVFARNTGIGSELDVTGPALGMLPKSNYGQRVVAISPGDSLTIYTDGITDARRDCDFFGVEGLTKIIKANSRKDAAGLAKAVFTAASQHSDGLLSDDAAVLVLKIPPQ